MLRYANHSDAQSSFVVSTLQSIASGGSNIIVVGPHGALKPVIRAVADVCTGQLFAALLGEPGKEGRLGAASAVYLGSDKRLVTNEYAICEAAKACKASIVLAAGFEPSELLAKVAGYNGWHLYAPMAGDKSLQYWTEQSIVDADFVPVWRKCSKCGLTHGTASAQIDAEKTKCPTCGFLERLNSLERIALTFDEGSFEQWDEGLPQPDPLQFPDYDATIQRNAERSGCEEAVRCGLALLRGQPVAVCVMDSSFMMGSMGSVVGEKITRCVMRATEQKLPVIIFCASGGARMQEGLGSLMQMAKVTMALEEHGRAGLPYFSVICDPTTGGVTASFAMQGDVVIAEPGALIGFAGRRVIQDTIHQSLPDDFQSAEFALEHGLVDAIVERGDLREVLDRLVRIHMHVHTAQTTTLHDMAAEPEDAVRQKEHAGLIGALREKITSPHKTDENKGLRKALDKRDVADAPGVHMLRNVQGTNANWESVLIARNASRPTSLRYIEALVDDFFELKGDRSFADDAAIVGGVGYLAGRAVTVIAQEKGSNLKERIARNFGCPHPEGYRKAIRLMQQAQKFNRPIVCLVDTQGAYCGKEAEERGIGNAIAECLMCMASLTVPVVAVVLGEGGSGGALALAVANRVAMQEHAVYSVLSPEGFASILWKDRSRAAEAADVMKMGALDALQLGYVEDVLSEGDGPAHENPEQAIAAVGAYLEQSLDELSGIDGQTLRAQRQQRFRNF